MPVEKERLDVLLVEKKLVQSRQRARSLIMAGRVLVDNSRVDKPGQRFCHGVSIELTGEDIPFVSRGGLKLSAALEATGFSVAGLICMDVGASTGGFTDCLLQNGAAKVYAVDVGYGQLAWKLRQNPQVIVIERTNIRRMPLEKIPEPVELITIDVSFISLKIVVPAVRKFMRSQGHIYALIKPQFEIGKGKVGKNGVVRDTALQQQVIDELSTFFSENGFHCGTVTPSPIRGPKGNQEFIIMLEAKSHTP
ncbi:MAG: TlyA family RNA methyltransferase [Desulfobacteraceae bacterium]|nr:TlyA family RNA methyltransferase [Desulfobacteraceae bacterium]